ncbi:MAG TPA: hypothetical protein VM469_03970 [Pseudoxanthomonas sp.]|nr:hypothetical protein [Pseudoxanthomonas sp.]
MTDTDTPLDPSQRRQRAMTEALREWDPEAEIRWDAESGRLSVYTTLPGERVSAILAALGEPVSSCGDDKPSGEACCGCCSH